MQTGVGAEHSAFVSHSTQLPVVHTGFGAEQFPFPVHSIHEFESHVHEPEQSPSILHATHADLSVLQVDVAPEQSELASQTTQMLEEEQTFVDPAEQSEFAVHATQVFDVVSHAGVPPEQSVLDRHSTHKSVDVLQTNVDPVHCVVSVDVHSTHVFDDVLHPGVVPVHRVLSVAVHSTHEPPEQAGVDAPYSAPHTVSSTHAVQLSELQRGVAIEQLMSAVHSTHDPSALHFVYPVWSVQSPLPVHITQS